ncbi:hypothetical protein [Pseudooceanicola sp. 200-1SW]|uniref:hypothetical protein n=1 Tax=Pseudooceanicola sp. 200-1SW TaxID=3425949 RepID=UPI003D7F2B85
MADTTPTHLATLVRGRRYILLQPSAGDPSQMKPLVFEKGVPVPVTETTKAYLDAAARDAVDYRIGAHQVSEARSEGKFLFEEIDLGDQGNVIGSTSA